MNVGATLKANAKTTKVVEPCVSTLDHPAKFAEATAMPGPKPRGSLDISCHAALAAAAKIRSMTIAHHQ